MQGGIKINSPLVKNKTTHGFTIVETMVVLAVTGMLFFSVMAVMSGRQNQAQFRQSINAVKTEIEQTINQVQTGHYPSTENFNCTASASGGVEITSTEDGAKQGENKDCVFFGRAIQFKVANEDRYAIFPLAGLRTAGSFAESKSKTVLPAVDTKMLQFGLEPVWVRSGGLTNAGAIGFVTKLEADGDSSRGTQSIQIMPVAVNLDQSIDETSGVIDTNISGSSVANGAQICYKSGVTKQHGIVSISGAGAVSLKIDNGDCPS